MNFEQQYDWNAIQNEIQGTDWTKIDVGTSLPRYAVFEMRPNAWVFWCGSVCFFFSWRRVSIQISKGAKQ